MKSLMFLSELRILRLNQHTNTRPLDGIQIEIVAQTLCQTDLRNDRPGAAADIDVAQFVIAGRRAQKDREANRLWKREYEKGWELKA